MPSEFSIFPYFPSDAPNQRVSGVDPNGPAMLGVTFTPTGGNPTPLLFAAAPADLLGPVAAIILNWSLLDRLFREATEFLLKYNKMNPPQWKTQEIRKILTLHKNQFELAFKDHPDILKHHEKQIMSRTWKAKIVRDLIAHAQITSASADQGPALKFVTKKLGRQSSKLFYADSLGSIAGHISASCGFLSELFTDPEALQVSTAGKSALRQILDKDRWDAAIHKAFLSS
jgi:hypothetical protein